MEPQISDLFLLQVILYAGALGLVLLGIYAIASRRHVIRILLGLTLMEAGVNLFLVGVGFRPEAAAPIIDPGQPIPAMVDPVPQALILTAIVIGVGVLALGLALTVRVFEVQGTLDMRVLARRLAQTGEGEGAEPVPTPPVSATQDAT